jgi:hypothetical protein
MLNYQKIININFPLPIKANPTILSRRGQKHNLTKIKVIPIKNQYRPFDLDFDF